MQDDKFMILFAFLSVCKSSYSFLQLLVGVAELFWGSNSHSLRKREDKGSSHAAVEGVERV